MYRKSIISIIIDNYNSLTIVEKIVADYFITNRQKVDFSSKRITKLLHVSEASLSRFAQKCGFTGYREFIYKYNDDFIENIEDKPYGFQDVINAYHQLLHQMVDYVDEEQIKRFSEDISVANRVLVLGVGSSGFAAREIKSRFMRLGVLMEACDQPDEMRMQSTLQGESNLVIGISLSGKKEEVLFSLKQAHNRGAKTVIITANSEMKYKYCNEKILIPSFDNLDTGNTISPQYPILLILDICYYYFFHNEASIHNLIELHQRTVQILKENSANEEK